MQISPTLSPFVGRSSELGLLLDLVRSTDAGAAVLIGGEAGVGKTRFLREFGCALDGQRLLATGRCLEYARSALHPIVEMLTELRNQRPAVLAKHARLRAVLDRLQAAPAASARDRSADERLMLFQTLEEAFALFARDLPLVLMVEDLQWADDSTIALLLHLTANLPRIRAALVVTYRTERSIGSDRVAAFARRMTRFGNVHQLLLAPLDEAEIDAIVAHLIGSALGPARRAEIAKRAEGNALFAEELAKHVLSAGEERTRHAALPQTITETVRSRVEAMRMNDRAILYAAAVLGRNFGADLLAEVTGVSPQDVLRALRDARTLELIVEDEPPRFSFRHALIQEALSGELLTMERQALHARILECLLVAAPPDVSALAYHAWAARSTTLSLIYNEQAGDHSWQAGAWIEASEYYDRAADSTNDETVLPRLYRKLARALTSGGFPDRAVRVFVQSLDLYERLGSMQNVASCCIDIFEILSSLGEDESSLTYLQRARDILASDPTRSSYLEAVLYTAHMEIWGGHVDRAMQRLDEIASDATAHPDVNVTARFYSTLADAHLVRRSYDLAIAAQSQAVAATPDTGDHHVEQLGRLGELLGVSARLTDAVTVFAQAAAAAEQRRDSVKAALNRMRREEMLLMRGLNDDDQLRTELETALAVAIRSDAPQLVLQTARVAIFYGDGRDDPALSAFVDRLVTQLDIEGRFRNGTDQLFFPLTGAYATWLFSKKRDEEAQEALERSVARLGRRRLRSTDWSLCTLVITAAHGDISNISVVREFMTKSHSALAPGLVPLFEALAAVRSGRPQDAREPALEAQRYLAAAGLAFEAGLAWELADEPQRAMEAFTACSRPRHAERVRRRLVPVNRRGRLSDELTSREQEIAERITQGCSNRAIADALNITEKTVETHVAKIFQRLGVRSRHDVAAALPR